MIHMDLVKITQIICIILNWFIYQTINFINGLICWLEFRKSFIGLIKTYKGFSEMYVIIHFNFITYTRNNRAYVIKLKFITYGLSETKIPYIGIFTSEHWSMIFFENHVYFPDTRSGKMFGHHWVIKFPDFGNLITQLYFRMRVSFEKSPDIWSEG